MRLKENWTWQGGTTSVDDSVIDKPYRDPSKTELIAYFWSGKHKRTVKGINLITLYYTDIAGNSYPVNFRIYSTLHFYGVQWNPENPCLAWALDVSECATKPKSAVWQT